MFATTAVFADIFDAAVEAEVQSTVIRLGPDGRVGRDEKTIDLVGE